MFCDRLRSYRNTLLRSSATVFYLLRSSAINCDRAIIWKPKIETYPIIFWIPTHDSTLSSNKATAYLKTWPALSKVTLMTFNNEQFIEEVNMRTFNTAKISKTKTKRLTDVKKSWRYLIHRRRTRAGCYLKRLKTLPSGSERDVPRELQNRLTKRRINLLAAKFLPRRPPFCCCDFFASRTWRCV